MWTTRHQALQRHKLCKQESRLQRSVRRSNLSVMYHESVRPSSINPSVRPSIHQLLPSIHPSNRAVK